MTESDTKSSPKAYEMYKLVNLWNLMKTLVVRNFFFSNF